MECLTKYSERSTAWTKHRLPNYTVKTFHGNSASTRDPEKCPYIISTELRLSIALHFFAGGSPYDIFTSHHVSIKSVYTSVWGVVDAINGTSDFDIRFPDRDEQKAIAWRF